MSRHHHRCIGVRTRGAIREPGQRVRSSDALKYTRSKIFSFLIRMRDTDGLKAMRYLMQGLSNNPSTFSSCSAHVIQIRQQDDGFGFKCLSTVAEA